MADRKVATIPPTEGETRFVSDNPAVRNAVYIGSPGGSGLTSKGSWLAIDGVTAGGAVTTWYLFVTAAGVLRIHNVEPTNTETNGNAV